MPVSAAPTGTGMALQWAWPTDLPADGLTRSISEIQWSADMDHWTTVEDVRGPIGGGGLEQVEVGLAGGAAAGFFRVRQSEQRALALEGGAEVFGFGRAFERAMEGIGFPTVDAFRAAHPAPSYLTTLSFDPTEAEYFSDLDDLPYVDYTLTPAQQTLYEQNGFVVSPQSTGIITSSWGVRTVATDFKGHYLAVYRNDLPVFVTADSMLHAWHRTVEPMIEELEDAALAKALRDLLEGMQTQIGQWDADGLSSDPFWGPRLRDLDVFLGVASVLAGKSGSIDLETIPESPALDLRFIEITGEPEDPFIREIRLDPYGFRYKREILNYYESVYGPEVIPALSEWFDEYLALRFQNVPGTGSVLGQETAVEGWITHIRNGAAVRIDGRDYDFSLYRPRGHYTHSANLVSYFQSMMWCGRQDFRMVDPTQPEKGRAELANAILLTFLLKESGQFERWEQFEALLTALFGPADSMMAGQMEDFLEAAGIWELADLDSEAEITALQNQLLSGIWGAQQITGHPFASPRSAEPVILPRSFTFLGQRFTFDGWAFSQMTFDDIRWPVDIPGKVRYGKVLRRMPSALDVAYSVLGNDHVGPVLAERMEADDGVAFRDGLPYQHNLLAVRETVDGIDPATWDGSVYSHWIHALRALSAPLDDSRLPQAMRTQAWGMKTTTAQLASWAQLRHTTVLYAKPTVTDTSSCDFPHGYVEPVPLFWSRMTAMATYLADQLGQLNITGTTTLIRETADPYDPWESFGLDIAKMLDRQEAHCREFALRSEFLRGLAQKELQGESFSAAESSEIRYLIYTTIYDRTYGGWYPQLYYAPVFAPWEHLEANYLEPLSVVDVHTDQRDALVGDPGGVLHAGVGRADLLLIAIDHPDGCKRLYAGPVSNFYEFIEPVGTRLNDDEWEERWNDPATRPPLPEWTAEYRVP